MAAERLIFTACLPSHHLDTRETVVEFLASNLDFIDYLLYVRYVGCHLAGLFALFRNFDSAFERENAVLHGNANELLMQAIRNQGSLEIALDSIIQVGSDALRSRHEITFPL